MKNLVIVANYNQKIEISNYLKELETYFTKDQVVVIDDGSTDGSESIAEQMGFHVIKHAQNQGIGAAIRSGLQFAIDNNFEGVLISSSNGKMVPSQFPSLLSELDKGIYPYIQGSRFLKDGKSEKLPLFRKLSIPFLSWIFTILFGRNMTDITCGLRAYKVRLLNDPRIHLHQEWLNQYELEYYLHIKFLRTLKIAMKELPVTIRYSHLQPHRQSKIRPFSGWWSMARPFILLFLRIED